MKGLNEFFFFLEIQSSVLFRVPQWEMIWYVN